MKKRPLAKVGDRIMRGEEQEETIGMEDALWIISLGLGLGKSQYRWVSISLSEIIILFLHRKVFYMSLFWKLKFFN